MKLKAIHLGTILVLALLVSSCAGSRSGYGTHRKGYGCPANASATKPASDKA